MEEIVSEGLHNHAVCICITHQVVTKPKKKPAKDKDGGEERVKRKRSARTGLPASKRTKLQPGEPGYDPYDFTSDEESEEEEEEEEEEEKGGVESMDAEESGPTFEKLTDER